MSKENIALKEVLTSLSTTVDYKVNITQKDFELLLNKLKTHPFYEDDRDEFSDTLDYIRTCEPYEWSALRRAFDGVSIKEFGEIVVESLDDQLKLELLINLYNNTSTCSELENLIKK